MQARFQELQAIARLLHNQLMEYPTEESIQFLIDNDMDQTWPTLSNRPENQAGRKHLGQFLSQWTPDQLNDTIVDYGDLFFGPSEPKAMPWGSMYLCEEQTLNDKSTLDLMDFYKQYGIEFDLKINQPVDHLGLFYAVIGQLIQQMLEQPDSIAKQALVILLQKHMLPWSARCLTLAIEHAQSDLYKGIAQLAIDFEKELTEQLGVVILPTKIFR
ncbi:molecular chaperone [Shewanella intestini]|uniref:Molecular chaperone TorD n=1 Tax=Shewanella intestini TaxID=2017544 RepID=A0ABS5I6H0_9GAMM|nr:MULTISPECIES: molecular chaperone TorD family protein [Shewanella]MBR9729622.1 molecular chaperone TorD [Shewanella intestini]MRG37692.1 molecular chaperone TorD [Shewanella sp. XMDDZSB0408]